TPSSPAAANPPPGAARRGAADAKRRRGGKPAPPTLPPTPVPAAPNAPASRPRITRDLSPVVYRATFERDVRIFEGDQQVAVGDHMNIDLLETSGHDSTTQPAVAGATSQSAAAAVNSAAPASRPSKRGRRPANADEG